MVPPVVLIPDLVVVIIAESLVAIIPETVVVIERILHQFLFIGKL